MSEEPPTYYTIYDPLIKHRAPYIKINGVYISMVSGHRMSEKEVKRLIEVGLE